MVYTTHKSITDESIQQMSSLSTLPSDNFRCYEIVDDLSGKGTLTEYLYGGQGQRCNKGIRQPSLMLIILFKQQLKSNTMLWP